MLFWLYAHSLAIYIGTLSIVVSNGLDSVDVHEYIFSFKLNLEYFMYSLVDGFLFPVFYWF